jgi:hypothetical protein
MPRCVSAWNKDPVSGVIGGLIIAIAVFLSLEFVVQGLLKVPVNGSVPLFMLGACLYLFFRNRNWHLSRNRRPDNAAPRASSTCWLRCR